MRYPGLVSRRFGPWLVGGLIACGGLSPVAVGQGTASNGNRTPINSRPTAPPAPRSGVADSLNFANGLYRNRQYDLAAEEFERVLRAAQAGTATTTAQLAAAWFGLGHSRLLLHKYEDARRAFEGFLQTAPDHPNAPLARYWVGESAYVLGDLPAARRSLETYTTDGAGDRRFLPAAWTILGDIATRSSDLPTARQAYEHALSRGEVKGSLGSRARLGLGRILAAQGESAPALKILRELVATGGPEWLDKAWMQIGQVEANSGHWAEAVAAFESLEQASPRSPLLAQGRLDRAEALIKLDQPAEAETLLRPLAADAHGSLWIAASDTLGTLLITKGQAGEALTVLDAALGRPGAAGPAATALRFHAAQAALMAGQTAEARDRFEAISRDEPTSSWADDAQLRAAALALDAKDYAAARRLAGAIPTSYPDSPLHADAHLIDARAALGLDQPKDAIAILTASQANDKPSPEVAQAATYYLGLAYGKDGQTDKATAALGKLASAPASTGTAAADAQYLLGQTDFNEGRFADAIQALEKYLEAKPEGSVAPDALARIALSQATLGQTDAADASLAKLVAGFPTSPTLLPTRLRLAEMALDSKRFDRAEPLFRQITDATDKPADPSIEARAWSGLGWSLYGANHPAEAASAFGTLIDLAPANPLAVDARFIQGRALQDAGQTDPAITAYTRALADHPDARQAGPAALALARLQVAAGQPAAAASTLQTVVENHADDAGEPKQSLLCEWGWALLDAGQTAEADKVFERLLADSPTGPRANDARFNLAESAYEARNLDRTVELLTPLVAPGAETRPELVERALYRIGRVEVDRRDWTAAATLLDRLIQDYPASSFGREARFWRAEVAFQAGDSATAATGFTALIDEPAAATDPQGMIGTARGRLAQVAVQQNRWADALSAADAWASSVPDPRADPIGPEVDYARGRALQGLARFDDARAAFDRAIEARPRSELAARAQLMRGETFFHQEQYRDALREFYRVVIQYNAPEWQATALLEAGKVHEKLDQWREAIAAYEKLRTQFPADPTAEEAGRRLEAARRHLPGSGELVAPTG